MNYGDASEKRGWLNVLYPDNKTRKLSYYSQFFNTVEMDAIFYKRFFMIRSCYFKHLEKKKVNKPSGKEIKIE